MIVADFNIIRMLFFYVFIDSGNNYKFYKLFFYKLVTLSIHVIHVNYFCLQSNKNNVNTLSDELH